jgi:hypothetical protein
MNMDTDYGVEYTVAALGEWILDEIYWPTSAVAFTKPHYYQSIHHAPGSVAFRAMSACEHINIAKRESSLRTLRH